MKSPRRAPKSATYPAHKPGKAAALRELPPAKSAPDRPSALLDTRVIYPIQAKQKDKVGRPGIDAFFKRSHKVIVALSVKEILDEQIAKKLA